MPARRATTHHTASLELAARHPTMATLIKAHGPVRIRPKPPVAQRFQTLARAIVFQQLAGNAARAIWGRVQEAVGDPFTPEAVLRTSDEALRAAGLSANKLAALRDLSAKVAAGDIDLRAAGRMGDEEVVAMLTTARGIGPWTAHMFLLFDLHRLDVWPTGDLGVRNGFQRAFELPASPSPRELEELGEPFRPYRSVVAWYCWRAADTVTP